MKSVMTHDFSRIPSTDIPRSCFDRSHGLKTSFDSGYLVPIEVQEVLPGDEVSMDCNIFARLMPVVTPIMDNVFIDTQWFFCPSRLLWTNFTKMMGERVNPADSIDYLVPQLTAPNGGFAVGSLADYFGIPTGVTGLKVNALPFRMYAKVWDDWYRDENLQDSIIQSSDDLGDSNGTIAWNTLLKRGKRHDYFTSCLPWPQKGEGVELPLGTSAPVVFGKYSNHDSIMDNTNEVAATGKQVVLTVDGRELPVTGADGDLATIWPAMKTSGGFRVLNPFGTESGTLSNGENTLEVDLSSATAATINSLRMAFQLQRLLESDARSGSRYCELIRGHFKTVCPDARLQRSEYLGGSSQLISFDEVACTSPNSKASAMYYSATPQGNLVANGHVYSTCRWRKAFTEHGYIIGLANVRCDLNYQQGLNRMWSRRGRYDFFWPVLQNLGEQAVLNKEIYAQGPSVVAQDDNGSTVAVDDKVFGYQERYAEYKYNPSVITGKMRSSASGSLDVWHLAQNFSALPQLNANFIQDAPPLSRIMALSNEPQILCDCYLKQRWCRPMYTYSIPGLIDHL